MKKKSIRRLMRYVVEISLYMFSMMVLGGVFVYFERVLKVDFKANSLYVILLFILNAIMYSVLSGMYLERYCKADDCKECMIENCEKSDLAKGNKELLAFIKAKLKQLTGTKK